MCGLMEGVTFFICHTFQWTFEVRVFCLFDAVNLSVVHFPRSVADGGMRDGGYDAEKKRTGTAGLSRSPRWHCSWGNVRWADLFMCGRFVHACPKFYYFNFQVEEYGFAWQAGLRQGSRLVEICKVAAVTLTHEQMIDLLRTSVTVKVVIIPPIEEGGPRRCVRRALYFLKQLK